MKGSSGRGAVGEPIVKADPEYQRICALLGISSQHLRVANEMRNLFGKGITDVHGDDENQAGRGGRRRQRGGQQQVDLESALKGQHPKGKGLPELTLRRNPFIQGKDDWPRSSTGGLTMEMVDNKAADGTVEFKYAYDQSYVAVQRAFQQAVEMGDPQQMIHLLKGNPYNISLLLIVSKIAKNQGDHALAADLLERALFTFGRAAVTMFNTKLAQGMARLDFARPENRELWLAGYHYIKALLMKGTYRTALEWAKLLLSLDPEGDPYCMRLVIHNLAIRGHEFQYLLNLYESKLPEIWSSSTSLQCSSLSHTIPSLAYAAMQLKDGAKCREILAKSMQETPWLFNRLFQELNLDPPSTIWGIMARTDAETLFTEIYVLQTKDLWNTPAATALLMEIAHTIPKVDEKAIPKLDNAEMSLDVVRYVYVDDNPAIMKYAPSHILHKSNNSDVDPLPPDVNIYSSYSVRNTRDEADIQRGFGLGGDMNDPMAALMALIQQRDGANIPQGGSRQPLVENQNDEFFEYNDDEDEDVMPSPGGGNTRVPSSIARRVLDMLWGTRATVDSESEEEEWETGDEMPELEDRDGRQAG
jgi:tetratricopeptide (TPR) repeat protein